MLSRNSKVLAVILFLIAVLLTGEARLSLDAITAPFRNDFREMQYFPRGNSLKILAFGFDTPLADALYIKGMVYFGDSLADTRKSDVHSAYTYELFDVVTDLSPRFDRAYEVGSIFLTSSRMLEPNLRGRDLLLKGVAVYDEFAANGEVVALDPRWKFHVLIANICDTNIQPKLRRQGDANGAANARIEAARHFRLAALSPRAPQYVINAASGYEQLNRGGGDLVEANAAVMAVWVDMHDQALARGEMDLASELESRILNMEEYLGNIVRTRELQDAFSTAGHAYLAATGSLPVGVADLARAGLIPHKPDRYPLDVRPEDIEEDDGDEKPLVVNDFFWVLPDGSFRSNLLSLLETSSQLDRIANALILYRRTNSVFPATLQDLVEDSFLDKLPDLPLATLGQVYVYQPEYGFVDAPLPYGPELPEHLR